MTFFFENINETSLVVHLCRSSPLVPCKKYIDLYIKESSKNNDFETAETY